MENELKEADKIIDFLDKFTIDHDNNDDLSKMSYHEVGSILNTRDIGDFLTKANNFFKNERNDMMEDIEIKVKTLEDSNIRLESDLNLISQSLNVVLHFIVRKTQKTMV